MRIPVAKGDPGKRRRPAVIANISQLKIETIRRPNAAAIISSAGEINCFVRKHKHSTTIYFVSLIAFPRIEHNLIPICRICKSLRGIFRPHHNWLETTDSNEFGTKGCCCPAETAALVDSREDLVECKEEF